MKKAKSVLSIVMAMLVVMSCMFAASAAEVTEKEDNGTAATAVSFEIKDTVKGALSKIDDVDYYSFKVEKAGLVTVSVAHNAIAGADPTSTVLTVEILDANGNKITQFTSKATDTKSSSDAFGASAETYYVEITAGNIFDNALGYNYELTASLDSAALSETEDNNTAAKANAMQLSASGSPKVYTGYISENDVDYYSITVPGPGIVYFYIYNGSAVRGNYSATLLSYVDKGEAVEKALGTITVNENEASKMSPGVGVNAGTYLIKIAGNGGSTGTYQTRAFYFTNDKSEMEYNNDNGSANFVNIGGTILASVFDKGDIDCFKFTVPANNYGYEITLKSQDTANEGKWQIVSIANQDGLATDKDGKVIADNVVATEKEEAKISTGTLAAGTYYIKVKAGNVVNNGIYELSIKAKDKPEEDEKDKNLWEKIQDLDWQGFWDNFSDWIGKIDFISIIKSISSSFIRVITALISMAG